MCVILLGELSHSCLEWQSEAGGGTTIVIRRVVRISCSSPQGAGGFRARSSAREPRGRRAAGAVPDTTGKVKVLADATTDRMLGVHIIDPAAVDLIGEAAVAMNFGAPAENMD